MGQRFNPRPVPRFDQSLIPSVNENFQQLVRLLANIPTETVSATAPDNPYLGQIWVDTSSSYIVRVWDGTRWQPDYVPFAGSVLSQGVTLSKTSHVSEYVKNGKDVFWGFTFTITSAGTASSVVQLTLPFAAADVNGVWGTFNLLDIGNTNWGGLCFANTTTSIVFQPASANNSLGPFGAYAAANGDVLRGFVRYKSAT